MDSERQPRLADELQRMQREPLLPIEKKLITWSIILGLVLLAVLTWVSYTFFPGQ
jgi:type VI protein secretion system component VasF